MRISSLENCPESEVLYEIYFHDGESDFITAESVMAHEDFDKYFGPLPDDENGVYGIPIERAGRNLTKK